MATLLLDPGDYPGGIAIWGGVKPIFLTAHHHCEEAGIHVHARKQRAATKDIDQSFSEVIFRHQASGRDVLIDEEAAVAFMIAQLLDIPMQNVVCEHCREDIVTTRQMAIFPDTSHHCQRCEGITISNATCIANPLIALRQDYSSKNEPEVIQAAKCLKLEWQDMPGGVEIWGSNQAIIWTAARPEEEGLHVHWYAADGSMVQDDTYSSVQIGSHSIDTSAARLWMAQQKFMGCVRVSNSSSVIAAAVQFVT